MNADTVITIAYGGPVVVTGLTVALVLWRRHRRQEAARRARSRETGTYVGSGRSPALHLDEMEP